MSCKFSSSCEKESRRWAATYANAEVTELGLGLEIRRRPASDDRLTVLYRQTSAGRSPPFGSVLRPEN